MSLTTPEGSNWPIPYVAESDCEYIGNLDVVDYGAGVVLFRNVLDVDQKSLLSYVDEHAEHSTPGIFLKEENGEQWCEDWAGEKFPVERYYSNPYRLGGYGENKPVMENTPPDIKEFFYENEHQMYLCLMKYIDIYTHLLNSLWWHFRGNVLKYFPNGSLGMHSDNDTSYKTIDGQRYETGRPEAIYQTLSILVYYNDSVDTEEELDGTNFMGGEMWFPYLNNLTYKPKTGDMLFFPANYVGTHGVTEVTAGYRYVYQSCYGQGVHTETKPVLIPGYETERLPWGMAGYLPWIHQDWERFSKSPYSRWINWPDHSPNGEINPLNRPPESEPVGPLMPYAELDGQTI
jgi:hypothetical protein